MEFVIDEVRVSSAYHSHYDDIVVNDADTDRQTDRSALLDELV